MSSRRDVPTDNSGLGATALESEPDIVQFFDTSATGKTGDAFENQLYVAAGARIHSRTRSRRATNDLRRLAATDVVVYKGLLKVEHLEDYYPDLEDEQMQSTLRDGPRAILDKHARRVAPRTPVPPYHPQRRDKHHPRQRQLDARAGDRPPSDEFEDDRGGGQARDEKPTSPTPPR